MYTDWDVDENKTCQNLAWSSPSSAGRVISKLVTFANAVSTLSNTYFLVPFYMYCSRQLIHCLKISGNMNNSRTIRGRNRQKNKNSPTWAESYWFFQKKSVYLMLESGWQNVNTTNKCVVSTAPRNYIHQFCIIALRGRPSFSSFSQAYKTYSFCIFPPSPQTRASKRAIK